MKESPYIKAHNPKAKQKTNSKQYHQNYIVKGKHMPSLEYLLDTANQIVKSTLNNLNSLFNADLHGLDALGLLIGINVAIAGFKKLVYHRR